jgi:hypothetical protein
LSALAQRHGITAGAGWIESTPHGAFHNSYVVALADGSIQCHAMVVAELDASLLDTATGRRWIRARRPELYGPLAIRTGRECDTRELKFQKQKTH